MADWRLIWLPDAVRDLQRLLRFLDEVNPEAARRAAGAIRRGAAKLKHMPKLGRPMADGSERRDLFVAFGASAYVLRYRLDVRSACVVVILAWHGREQRL